MQEGGTICHISSKGLNLRVSGDVDRVATLWLWAADIKLVRTPYSCELNPASGCWVEPAEPSPWPPTPRRATWSFHLHCPWRRGRERADPNRAGRTVISMSPCKAQETQGTCHIGVWVTSALPTPHLCSSCLREVRGRVNQWSGTWHQPVPQNQTPLSLSSVTLIPKTTSRVLGQYQKKKKKSPTQKILISPSGHKHDYSLIHIFTINFQTSDVAGWVCGHWLGVRALALIPAMW